MNEHDLMDPFVHRMRAMSGPDNDNPKPARKRTSGRPFWDEQLAKKDTMIRAQAEEIDRLKIEIQLLRREIASHAAPK